MKIYKPKFWSQKRGVLSSIFFPISLIYEFLGFLKKKFTKTYNFEIPIICIGNIFIGGTGKTPLTIFLTKELIKIGKNPVVLRKFYKKHLDEHKLIKNYLNNIILNKSRSKGVMEAIKKNYDAVILDDGFQDYSINKKLNIICFNQNQLLGNELIFPSGPLRQKLVSLKEAQIIIINGIKNLDFEEKLLNVNKKLEIFYSKYIPINLNEFRGKKLFAFAGIGNPVNFFNLLSENGLDVVRKIEYPDHYKINRKEISNIMQYCLENNLQIITTEKDYFRIQEYKISNLKYLKIKLKLDDAPRLINKVLKYYE